MKAREELAQLPPSGPVLVTIGVFDGVHRGHQHLLERLKGEARARSYNSAVVTFHNHPITVLRPETPVSYISSSEERLRLLGQAGVDLVVPLTFDRELSLLRPGEFVGLLREGLDLRGLVVGADFAMGHQREGTVPVLQDLGQEMDFTVQTVDPLEMDGQVVSSTDIRGALAQGDAALAARMLGHPFTLQGRIATGEGRGRRLGFPTANLEVDPSLLTPGNGIYATWVKVNGARRVSATSIGVRPTFGPGRRTVETHILDFSGDLYEAELQLEFVCRLREEWSFDSVEDLVAQMHRDVAQVRMTLAS